MRRVLWILAVFASVTFIRADAPWYPIEPFNELRTFKDGDWELRMYYIHKGTPLEGMNGDLLYQGKRLSPVVPPGYIHTPLGDLTWFPSPQKPDFAHGNVVIGWTFKDYSKVPWTTATHPAWPERHDWREEEVKLPK